MAFRSDVDPPAFAYKLDGVFDIKDIQGKLTIDGGEDFETLGDRLVVHNQDGTVHTGTLTAGNLSGFGLGQGSVNGEDYDGVDYENLEFVDLRLSDSATPDVLTIDGTQADPTRVVLGAGNVSSIGPMDTLYKLFAEGQVVILKMNPVNEYLGPFIDEAFAQRYFPGASPLGGSLDIGNGVDGTYEIVGIVGNQQQETPRDPARAEVFENRNQDWNRTVWVVLRTSLDPDAAIPIVRETLREIDPLIPIATFRPLRDVWSQSMARERLVLVLLGIFAGVALLLAAVGVYGVTAQALRARTSEIGVRMALGAAAPDVVRMMLRQALGLVAFGLAAGLVGALLLARVLDSLVYGVQSRDPGTFTTVAIFLALVALFASWLPARRASAVDPAVSLRTE